LNGFSACHHFSQWMKKVFDSRAHGIYAMLEREKADAA
jgi:hypothetical protein